MCIAIMKAFVVIVLLSCVARTFSDDSFQNNGVRFGLKIYDECSKGEFLPCLKKKAIVMMDRISRMEKISVVNGVTIMKALDTGLDAPNVTTDETERNRSQSVTLDEMLMEKFTRLVGSRKIEFSLPKLLPKLEESKYIIFRIIYSNHRVSHILKIKLNDSFLVLIEMKFLIKFLCGK